MIDIAQHMSQILYHLPVKTIAQLNNKLMCKIFVTFSCLQYWIEWRTTPIRDIHIIFWLNFNLVEFTFASDANKIDLCKNNQILTCVSPKVKTRRDICSIWTCQFLHHIKLKQCSYQHFRSVIKTWSKIGKIRMNSGKTQMIVDQVHFEEKR